MFRELTLEDFENPDGEFDLVEAPDFLKGAELTRFNAKYRVVERPMNYEVVGDDGICRTFPGASFWYD